MLFPIFYVTNRIAVKLSEYLCEYSHRINSWKLDYYIEQCVFLLLVLIVNVLSSKSIIYIYSNQDVRIIGFLQPANSNYYQFLESSPVLMCEVQFSSDQSLSRVQLFGTPWTATFQDSLSITNSWSLFRLMSIKSVMPSNHLILWHPLLLLPSIIPSIRLFSNESVICIMWPKYWSFSFSISPSNEYSGLISLGLTGLISLQSKLLSRVFSSTTVQKQQFSNFLNSSDLTSTHDY